MRKHQKESAWQKRKWLWPVHTKSALSKSKQKQAKSKQVLITSLQTQNLSPCFSCQNDESNQWWTILCILDLYIHMLASWSITTTATWYNTYYTIICMLAALLGNSLVGNLTFLDGGFDSRILHLLCLCSPLGSGWWGRQQAGLRPSGGPSATSQPPQLSSSLTIAYYKIYLIIYHIDHINSVLSSSSRLFITWQTILSSNNNKNNDDGGGKKKEPSDTLDNGGSDEKKPPALSILQEGTHCDGEKNRRSSQRSALLLREVVYQGKWKRSWHPDPQKGWSRFHHVWFQQHYFPWQAKECG